MLKCYFMFHFSSFVSFDFILVVLEYFILLFLMWYEMLCLSWVVKLTAHFFVGVKYSYTGNHTHKKLHALPFKYLATDGTVIHKYDNVLSLWRIENCFLIVISVTFLKLARVQATKLKGFTRVFHLNCSHLTRARNAIYSYERSTLTEQAWRTKSNTRKHWSVWYYTDWNGFGVLYWIQICHFCISLNSSYLTTWNIQPH
jgi:hypothetical protein